jgi:AraC-like DNA-binding protein
MDVSTSLTLNLLLRGGALLTLLHIAVAMLRDYPGVGAARIGAAFAFGTGAFVANSVPGFAAHPTWWHAPLIALDAGNMFIFWLFTRALLDDTFHLLPRHVAGWGTLAALGLLNCFVFSPSFPRLAELSGMLLTLSTIMLAILSVAQSLATWREDLVEGRRRMRMLLVASAAGYSILMAGMALASGHDAREVFSGTTNASGIALLSLLVVLQLTRGAGHDLFAPRPESKAGTLSRPVEYPVSTADPGTGTGTDPELVDALKRLMTDEGVYREENLTVAALAERMKLPEHRLRKLINQGLGYRNFNVFLNTYRIDHVAQALSDPVQADVPILTIALDAGFQSLGPFNRAFKACMGLTPSEFRRGKGVMAAK